MSADNLHVALFGAGQQGGALLEICHRLPGIRIQAVCDIWDYRREHACRLLRCYGHHPTGYADYRDLLAKERGLDAALIATPDWMHAEQTNACLTAGLHVYCEPEMARTVDEARSMVRTARATGKLLQIGRQRRSNPRYRHAIDKLIRELNLLGRLTHGQAQWHRPVAPELGWPRPHEIDQATLDRYGYTTMREFMNWPWFTKYSVGLVGVLSSHQIDLFRWAFGVHPSAIVASGGVDFYQGRQNFDNVTCILDFPTPLGLARASCQLLTTTMHRHHYEAVIGINGSVTISEVPAFGNFAEPENRAQLTPAWYPFIQTGLLHSFSKPHCVDEATGAVVVDVGETVPYAGNWLVFGLPFPTEETQPKPLYELPFPREASLFQPHLKNFFAAIHDKEPLNCPGEDALATAVTVFKIHEAVATGRKLVFAPEEFVVT